MRQYLGRDRRTRVHADAHPIPEQVDRTYRPGPDVVGTGVGLLSVYGACRPLHDRQRAAGIAARRGEISAAIEPDGGAIGAAAQQVDAGQVGDVLGPGLGTPKTLGGASWVKCRARP